MHIVWLILKIIGAILGGLLGFLLLLLLLVVFVPIRYKIRLKVDKGVEADSYISWLLHIVHISIQYQEKKMKYCLRIFGVPVRKNKEENDEKIGKSKQKKKRSVENTKQKKTTKSHVQEEQAKVEITKKAQIEPLENKTKQKTQEKTNEKTNEKTKQCITSSKAVSEKREMKETEKHKKKKRFHPIQKFKSLIRAIREKIHQSPLILIEIKNRIIKLNQKKKKVLVFIKDEGTKSTIKQFTKRTFEILKYIAPRKLRGYIRYGTGDPCNTGQILGIISILRAYFKTKISIYPVFEEKTIEADLTAHGRMRVFRFLRVGGSLYFDKEVKKFIADGKQLKEELNG